MQTSTCKGFQDLGIKPHCADVAQISGATSLREVEAGLTVEARPLPTLEPALSGVQRWPIAITRSSWPRLKGRVPAR